MFVDKVKVEVRAGNGGNGVVSFRHEKFVDKGGPDGGDGGNGGDVILIASRNQHTLAAFRHHRLVKAENGTAGAKQKKHGKSGDDLYVEVPVGTVVSNEDGEVLADLPNESQEFIVAKGGEGGFGNAHFTSSRRQTPRVAEKGEKGETGIFNLELKTIADVGLVGLPNAGKSTFLSVVSNAKPEIADYPFTTLIPNLGVVDVDGDALVFADIPGLIKGASEGKGLGDDFLRHVERTRVLLHLIDVYNDSLKTAYETIMEELASYKVDLTKKEQIVALTKIDGIDDELLKDRLSTMRKFAPKATIFAISSKDKTGVKELLRAIKKISSNARKNEEQQNEESGIPVISLPETSDSWKVEKTKNEFFVTGRKVERFAQRTDFEDYHAVTRLRDIMKKMGIMHELRRKGVEAEQIINIANIGSFPF